MNIAGIGDEITLKSVVASDVADRIIRNWKASYGEVLDYGGGEKDVLWSDFVATVDGKPAKVQSLFGLSKSESQAILRSAP